MPANSTPLRVRFEAKVDRSGGPDACHPWIGWNDGGFGYGRLQIGGRGGPRPRAHRVAWELAYGPIPDGLQVLHRCDNPPCVNPCHLFLGTAIDNVQDRHEKGRSRGPCGEDHGRSKLTEDQVREIRRLQGIEPVRAIAAKMGVSPSAVQFILIGHTWRHLLS